MLATLSIIILFSWTTRQRYGGYAFLILVAPFIPFLLLKGSDLLGNISIISQFSRHDADIITISGRALIWEVATVDIVQLSGDKFFGYGMYGHYLSGISSLYKNFNFLERGGPNLTSMHNSSFQMIYDIGYVGYALFTMMIFIVMRSTDKILMQAKTREQDRILRTIMALLLFYSIEGALNVSLTPHNNEVFAIVMLLIVSSLPLVEFKSQDYWVRRRVRIKWS